MMRDDHPAALRVRKVSQEYNKAQSKLIDAKNACESARDHMRVTITQTLKQHPTIIRDPLVLHHVICTLCWSSPEVIAFCDEHGIPESREWFYPTKQPA